MTLPSFKRQSLFGVEIDAIRMSDAVDTIRHWIHAHRKLHQDKKRCHYVVTPNVDHAVLLQENEALKSAYKDSDLVLADGHPIVWASRLLRRALPERVPGSDLVPRLLAEKFDKPLRVFLLGAAPGVGKRAAEKIEEQYSDVEVVGAYSPPLGFEHDEDENEMILGRILLANPDLLVVGLGAPKQELWVHRHREKINAPVALCVGATIDFLAGEKQRAPQWMRSTGVEWVHRMCSEPKRLVKRYAKDAWIFPQLVLQQWWTGKNA